MTPICHICGEPYRAEALPDIHVCAYTSTIAEQRKAAPVFSGVLAYFPDALLEVARVSKAGNDQHNPGEPLHWAKEKSTDDLDALTRHLLDHSRGELRDTDGQLHLAKSAWRNLAALQRLLDASK